MTLPTSVAWNKEAPSLRQDAKSWTGTELGRAISHDPFRPMDRNQLNVVGQSKARQLSRSDHCDAAYGSWSVAWSKREGAFGPVQVLGHCYMTHFAKWKERQVLLADRGRQAGTRT